MRHGGGVNDGCWLIADGKISTVDDLPECDVTKIPYTHTIAFAGTEPFTKFLLGLFSLILGEKETAEKAGVFDHNLGTSVVGEVVEQRWDGFDAEFHQRS